MFLLRTRIALVAALLLTFLPAAIIAQDAEVRVPVAVVALEGAYEAGAGEETCELVWESAGTPTLRVIASDGARFRQNLVGGQLATIPDVDDALACLFVVEVVIPEARRYSVTIEGEEIVELAAADLDDLQGAVVLPIAMDDEGRYELVTDDYLDIPLDDLDGGTRPVEQEEGGPGEPGADQPEETPAPAATPIPSEHDGALLETGVMLFVYDDFTAPTDEGCRIDAADDATVLVEASSGAYRSMWTPGNGVPVTASESPVGEAGCVFQRTLRLPGADSYTFTFAAHELATVPFEDLERQDGALLLAVDRNGNRTPGDPVTVAPVASPVPSPAPGTALPEGLHEVVGRLNMWTGGPQDVPFGCAAGPNPTGVHPGAQVVVRDGDGNIIGYGTLVYSDRSGSTVCSFDFTVEVPEATFYVFEIPNGDRHVASLGELELWNWHVFIDTGAR